MPWLHRKIGCLPALSATDSWGMTEAQPAGAPSPPDYHPETFRQSLSTGDSCTSEPTMALSGLKRDDCEIRRHSSLLCIACVWRSGSTDSIRQDSAGPRDSLARRDAGEYRD